MDPSSVMCPVVDLARLRMLARAMEQVGEGVAVYDNDDILVYANPAFAAMHGRDSSELEGEHFSALMDTAETAQDADDARVQRVRDEADGGEVTRLEFATEAAAGRRTVQVTVSRLRDEAHHQIGRVVCVLDVSDRKLLETQLHQAATHDPLTGLPNRRLLFECMESALAAAEGEPTRIAVLFLDLDGFKVVNDTHGHDVGDQLLRLVADRLTVCIRSGDTLARLAGDEFVVLLTDLGADEDATAMAARILDQMSDPFAVGELRLPMTASIGVAIAHGGRPRDILHAADSAMYHAKIGGAGRIAVSAGAPTRAMTGIRTPA
jgi:diguanylate cyclase (GGDEF)-like protein/PAS domain S-box-containing protein